MTQANSQVDTNFTGPRQLDQICRPESARTRATLGPRTPSACAETKIGGYFVLGQLSNESEVEAGTSVQIEVRAYDGSDGLLGVDWFASAAPAPGESAPFDLGGLRYEEAPELVRPAPIAAADADVNP